MNPYSLILTGIGIALLISGIANIMSGVKSTKKIAEQKKSKWQSFKSFYNQYLKKRSLFEYYFEERLSEKTNRIIKIVSGGVFILLGLYLLLKGVFDPSFSSFWVKF